MHNHDCVCVLVDSHEGLASRLVRFLLSRIINEQVCVYVCTYVVLQREEEEEQTEEEELEESPPSLCSCLLACRGFHSSLGSVNTDWKPSCIRGEGG